MFLKNFGKAVLVMLIIYILAFMAVVWAPWDPSPNFTTVMDDFRRDMRIGFDIYQVLVLACVMLMSMARRLTYIGEELSAVLALLFIPMEVLSYFGPETLFSSWPLKMLQMAATTMLFWLIFTIKSRQNKQPTPA